MISIVTLGIVFVLIAVRQVGNIRLRIWQIMLLGALVVLVTGQISPAQALAGDKCRRDAFPVRRLHHRAGAGRKRLPGSPGLPTVFRKARSLNTLVLFILFGMGMLSALLLNDTLAIIGTPVVLSLASKTDTQPKILLLSLAFAVTIGSVMSPIGNPQNLLIAIHGNVPNPFITFLKYLLAPTLVNLFLAYLLLRLFYRKHFDNRPAGALRASR